MSYSEKDPMKIIAFTGMPFSGKSEAVQIAKYLGIPVVRMGDAVWEEVTKQGLPLTDEYVGKTANDMRKQQGMNIWAKKTLQKIKQQKQADTIVIDGIRNIEEIDTFKKTLGNQFVVIAVEASDNTRYQRAMARGRPDDSMNLKKIKERDQREITWGLNTVIAQADIVVSNEGDLEEFKSKIMIF